MIDRRTFIARTARGAATAALANFLPLSSAQAHAPLLPGAGSAQLVAGNADRNAVVFKIDGWDRCEGLATNGAKLSSADPLTNGPTDNQVWITINQSWRTAWR
jgi:hypothetical protein